MKKKFIYFKNNLTYIFKKTSLYQNAIIYEIIYNFIIVYLFN